MIKKILWIVIFTVALGAYGQNIDHILEKDPFDPNRGKVEVEEVEEEEEAPVIAPRDLPVLDATFIFGESRFALFTMRDGKDLKTVRVALEQEFEGLTLSKVEKNYVEVSKGGKPIKIAMYSGNKTDRGGHVTKARNTRGKKPGLASAQSKPKVISADTGTQNISPAADKGQPNPGPTPVEKSQKNQNAGGEERAKTPLELYRERKAREARLREVHRQAREKANGNPGNVDPSERF